jgi:hypothetical protein
MCVFMYYIYICVCVAIIDTFTYHVRAKSNPIPCFQQPTKKGLLQHHYTLRPDAELGRIFQAHSQYQQQLHKDSDAHGSRHVDRKHATAPVMEEGFEKALAAVGRRFQVDDLPRLYRRWKPLS